MPAEILKEQNANKEKREIESWVEVPEGCGIFFFIIIISVQGKCRDLFWKITC